MPHMLTGSEPSVADSLGEPGFHFREVTASPNPTPELFATKGPQNACRLREEHKPFLVQLVSCSETEVVER